MQSLPPFRGTFQGLVHSVGHQHCFDRFALAFVEPMDGSADRETPENRQVNHSEKDNFARE
jgi:hypothetical protein